MLLRPGGAFRTMTRLKSPKPSYLLMLLLFSIILYVSFEYNVFEYALAYPFYFFRYPLETDMKKLVGKVMMNEQPGVEPISPFQYPIILDNNRLCKTEDGDEDSVFLLWVIKSKIENFDQREAIRRTWGAEDLVDFTPIRRVFLLGVEPGNTKLQQKVALEHRENQDIVQGYFVDNYFNNTVKLMMGFQWAVSRCRGARFIGFSDDDFFISPFNVVDALKPIPQAEWENFIMGYIWDSAMPLRLPKSKWYISLSEYPYRFWPPYPTAGCFFVSMLTAERLYIGMQYTKYLRFDDVYVGIVAWKLEIPLKHNKFVYFHREQFPGIAKTHKKILGVHGFKDTTEILDTWKEYMKIKGNHVSDCLLTVTNCS